MKTFSGALLACLCLALVAGVASADDENARKTSTLKYKKVSKWNIVLPKETFTPVKGEISIPHADGSGFAAELDGTALHVDCNGDGKPDAKAKGAKGDLVLKAKNAEGSSFQYAVRLVNDGGWKYSAAGVMSGKIEGTSIQLIDQNNNGRYSDYGEDAMIVGKTKSASLLSRIVACGDELFEIEVSKDGREISYEPYAGETGLLDLRSKFASKGKLQAVVVSNQSGDVSFELSSAKKGLRIPADTYRIVSGLVTKGKETVKVRTGNSKPIRVADQNDAVFAWGGPLETKFEYDRTGEEVTFSPNRIWFYGKSGVEFYDWFPDGKPPKFVIRDAKSGRELNQAAFGGC